MASPPPRPLLCPTDVNGNGIPEPPSQPLSTMSSSPSPKPQTASPNTTDNTNTSTPALPLPPISTLLNPAVPPTPGSMIMDCTSDPSRFHPIAIHTAKCAICDKRNMDKMLRCPGCTYQVCAPCCDSRAGAPLVHGNSNPDALIAGLNMTPVRRRVMNRADNGVPATGGTELGMAKAKGKATAKGKGHKKRKSKGKFEEGSEDSDAEETQSVVSNVSASSVEVMPVSKRRKTVSDASKGKSPLGMTVENSSGGVLRRRIDTSMLGREVGENTIQALLEKEGVDTPALRYHEHLLSRSQPVGVNSPPRFTAVNRHQKSVSEDDGSRNGQGVAREKTTETGIEPNMNEMNLHVSALACEGLRATVDTLTGHAHCARVFEQMHRSEYP
ncbi:hypothetical protein M011DRAFT_258119 [Sporormia fimetaria CBS 119925]|uniref:Uncharacterized protein n=1 Tax=Sporormia fimetaria CBS 119925 TaxID=1340428 RepID=A0A6A6UWY9_9PLEO|nr:hypothetical protein M011DRAFT_258119 [Sporormia fimetaria CBS 119925]